MIRVLAFTVLSTVFLTACGTRFGHVMTQAIVRVETDPPGLAYYVVDKQKAREVLGRENTDIPHGKSPRVESFLGTQLKAIADGAEFSYEVGSYVAIVVCPKFYRARLIQIRPDDSTRLTLTCE